MNYETFLLSHKFPMGGPVHTYLITGFALLKYSLHYHHSIHKTLSVLLNREMNIYNNSQMLILYVSLSSPKNTLSVTVPVVLNEDYREDYDFYLQGLHVTKPLAPPPTKLHRPPIFQSGSTTIYLRPTVCQSCFVTTKFLFHNRILQT